jgi:prevent-host-death family protein
MEELGIEDARRQLGEIVNRAHFAERHTLITRQGKPVAVVVNADWYSAVSERPEDLAGKEINHRDGDPRNLDPSNLEIRERS